MSEPDEVEQLRAERNTLRADLASYMEAATEALAREDALQAKLDAVYSTRATTVRGKGGLLEQLAILAGEETS